MNSLTNIVKSIAVVDDRPAAAKPAVSFEGMVSQASVLKREYFSAEFYGNYSREQEPPQKYSNSYLQEINRLKLEIAQAKADMRNLRRQADEAVQQAKRIAADAEKPVLQEQEFFGGEQADAMVAQARAQVDQILAQALAESNMLLENAKNEGYLEGFSQGFEQAAGEFKKENNPKSEAISELLERLSDYEQETIRKNEQGLVRLVTAIAEKIIGEELEHNPQLVVSMLHEALEQNRREDYIKVTLAPDLLPVEAKASEKVRALIQSAQEGIAVAVDKEMRAGGCIVETSKGITDISISTQLNNIEEILLAK